MNNEEPPPVTGTSPPAAGDHADLGTVKPLAPVGRSFIVLYTLSYAGGSLVLIAPLLVTLALKVDALVGLDRAPENLALVTGVGRSWRW